jgi:ABC-2 type transport system permease protein
VVFLRSFVYKRDTKLTFLVGQFLAYSFMSVVYCAVFYGLTRSYFGMMVFSELVVIVARFYMCFLLFSVPALLLTLIPVGFQNTNTLFSIVSFCMLALGIASLNSAHPIIQIISVFNPMSWANRMMVDGVGQSLSVVWVVVVLFVSTGFITFRYLLINPVWSRY